MSHDIFIERGISVLKTKTHLISILVILIAASGLRPSVAIAAPSCSLRVPSYIRVASPLQTIYGLRGEDCGYQQVGYAAWATYNGGGPAGVVIFDETGTSSTRWDIYASFVTPGAYKWQPLGAVDSYDQPLAQNTPTTAVKLGSGAAVTATRSGSYITLRTSSWRYAYSLNQWVRMGGVVGTIQYWTPTGWVNFKYAYPDASGYYSYRAYVPQARAYRVVFPTTTNIWGTTSPATIR